MCFCILFIFCVVFSCALCRMATCFCFECSCLFLLLLYFSLYPRCCVFSIFRLAPTWQVGPPVQAGACAELCEHLHSKNFSCHYVYVLQGNMSASMYLRKIQTTNELLISKRGVGEEGRAVYSRSVDLVNSMIYGLKKSVGLR